MARVYTPDVMVRRARRDAERFAAKAMQSEAYSPYERAIARDAAQINEMSWQYRMLWLEYSKCKEMLRGKK